MRGWAALAVVLACAAAAPAPRPTPPVFATSNYQLTFRIPAGLFRCPYPDDWVGPDHGVEFYLTRPRACDPAGPAATERERSRPRIGVYYEYNSGESVRVGNDMRFPATDAEIMAGECRHPRGQAVWLLGRPATGCQHRSGRAVTLVIGAVYWQSPDQAGPQPDSDVRIELDTQADRYLRDLGVLRAVAASLRVCGDRTRTVAPDLPARGPRCPLHTQW